MYLDVCRTQRLKSPGVPHRILAAPLPEAQYLFSRLVPLLFLAIGSPPRKLGRYAPRGVRAEERDTPSLNQRRTEILKGLPLIEDAAELHPIGRFSALYPLFKDRLRSSAEPLINI